MSKSEEATASSVSMLVMPLIMDVSVKVGDRDLPIVGRCRVDVESL